MSKVGKVFAAILLTPIALVVLGIGVCEGRKAYYDWRVKQMCEKDGGISIYEHIRISPQTAARMSRVAGHLSITYESSSPPNDVAFLRGEPEILRTSEPSIHRHEQSIVRRTDGKIVARMVRYGRAGGDFPLSLSNPSTFSCPEWPKYYSEIAKVFVVEEAK